MSSHQQVTARISALAADLYQTLYEHGYVKAEPARQTLLFTDAAPQIRLADALYRIGATAHSVARDLTEPDTTNTIHPDQGSLVGGDAA